MKIEKTRNEDSLTIALEGRLDTTTSPMLEEVVNNEFDGVKNVVFDFENLEYISSAGLRMLLVAAKKMKTQGEMTIVHVKPEVYEVFEITGFCDILTIK